jgi:hypothetical protein
MFPTSVMIIKNIIIKDKNKNKGSITKKMEDFMW